MSELRDLTEMQRGFVLAFTSDRSCMGKPEEAAIAAGFSPKTARVQAQQLLTKPHVKAAIHKANLDQIGRFATVAIAVLGEIMEDKSAPKNVRVDAAKTLLDRAGIVPPRTPAASDDLATKDLASMTGAELSELAGQATAARKHLEARLKDISDIASQPPQIEACAVAVDGESGGA